jgi:glutamyl-tRNA synthetase
LGALRESFSKQTEWTAVSLEAALKQLAAETGCKAGDLVHPARVAVSGRSIGPSLYHMLEVMGKDRVLQRIQRALTQFG